MTTINKALDLIFPDPVKRDEAKLALLKAEQEGRLEEIKQSMSAILAEANSQDPWTSRARPSFLYVMYALILAAIPFALVWAFFPDRADLMATGLNKWLAAIPDSMWWLFGTGYLGYTTSKGFENWFNLKRTWGAGK